MYPPHNLPHSLPLNLLQPLEFQVSNSFNNPKEGGIFGLDVPVVKVLCVRNGQYP